MVTAQHIYSLVGHLTLNCWLSTASYSIHMVLRSVSWFWPALSRWRSSSCRANSAPSCDWHLSTGWDASRYIPSSTHLEAWGGRISKKKKKIPNRDKDEAITLGVCVCVVFSPSPNSGAAPWLWGGGPSWPSGCCSHSHWWLWARCIWAEWSPQRSGSSGSAHHPHGPTTRLCPAPPVDQCGVTVISLPSNYY